MPKASSKSQFAKNLDAIQAAVNSFLKPLEFRKKGRTYNRRTNDGLAHVINFQMGQFPIGDNYVIPGFRENLHGKFAINLGVLLPCVYEVERQRSASEFIQEYECTIRERLGTLGLDKGDWFEITDDVSTLATTIVSLLDRFGLVFLEQFRTYQDVLSYYNLHGILPFRSSHRAALDAALIAHHLGDDTLSKKLFGIASTTDNKGFKQHIAEIEKRIKLSPDLSTTRN
jgi:hypothetical protein